MKQLKSAMLEIEQLMAPALDNAQMGRLRAVLEHCLFDIDGSTLGGEDLDNDAYLDVFLKAKRLEGCSERTIGYYQRTIEKMLDGIGKVANHITTDDLRTYLADYQGSGRVAKTTVDNVRRVLSTFFSWLEDENYILKSPVRRIKKIRTAQVVKETYSDETLELMRDLAMIDLLSSTGMRVGELVKLNRSDVNFNERECIVFGKGNKERIVYFNARTKIHLQQYLKSRKDKNPALFVSLNKPHERLQISGVETMLRKLGQSISVGKVHPHKFRRTLATRAIDKGMPIEQVQVLLGHKKIDTTLQYAMVDQRNVKNSHRRFIAKSRFVEMLKEFEEEVVLTRLEDIVEANRPITYGIVKPGQNVDGGVPIVKVKDFPSGVILTNDLLYASPEIESKYERSRLLPGDLLFSIRGSVGRMAFVPEELEGANLTQDTARLTIRSEFDPIYIRGVLSLPQVGEWITKHIRGVAMQGVNLADLRKLEVPILSNEHQRELRAFVAQVDKSEYLRPNCAVGFTMPRKSGLDRHRSYGSYLFGRQCL